MRASWGSRCASFAREEKRVKRRAWNVMGAAVIITHVRYDIQRTTSDLTSAIIGRLMGLFTCQRAPFGVHLWRVDIWVKYIYPAWASQVVVWVNYFRLPLAASSALASARASLVARSMAASASGIRPCF